MPVDKLHPGVRVALARGRMDEAQVARAMAAGELVSPQRYGNSWLFNLRITGTGASYREAHDEYVWRDPSIYLNQGFLDRCAGLPVILEHPNREMLDSGEYHDRNIGSIMYPYIRGDEVWGIARIIDQPAARLMAEIQLSTSPAVVFTPKDGNEQIDAGNGKHILIEGKPSLLDHLAICEEGVWDKGGPPAGVDVTGSDRSDAMPDVVEKEHEKLEKEMAREDRARRDESEDKREREEERADNDGDKLDRLLEGIKTISDRQDAIEASMNDRARRDESEDKREREEERADRRRSDRGGRKDTDPEHEAEQAVELHKLAEEEEKEAEEAAVEEAEDDGRKDRRRADKRRDDSDIEEHFMPWEEAVRKEGESDSAYSKRMDALANRHDRNYAKRDDESTAAHCDRIDRAYRKDRARRDAQGRLDSIPRLEGLVEKLVTRMDSLAERLQDRSDEDEAKFADVRARADAVYEAHGDHAPRPMRGENLVGYRIRLARGLQKYSDAWKGADIAAVARSDSTTFGNAEAQVYADAMAAARAPTAVPPGELREVIRKLPYGREIVEFQGSPLAWMQSFMMPAQGARITARPGQHMPRQS